VTADGGELESSRDTGSVRSSVARVLDVPVSLLATTGAARTGFLRSGGNTNLVVPVRGTSDAPSHPSDRSDSVPQAGDVDVASVAIPSTTREHVRAALTGLAVVFVPISMVQDFSGIQLTGGRGLLPISDLDTLFIDATSVMAVVLLWKRRRLIGERLPVVVFALILSATTAILLGYVVTNFGTLWRMRTLVVIPLWLSMMAISPRARGARCEGDSERLRWLSRAVTPA
jgi:hypothetical protein